MTAQVITPMDQQVQDEILELTKATTQQIEISKSLSRIVDDHEKRIRVIERACLLMMGAIVLIKFVLERIKW